MFWKVYLWVVAALSAIGAAMELAQPAQVSWPAWGATLIFAPMTILALWSVAYDRTPLPAAAWKAMLGVSILWDAMTVGHAVSVLQAQFRAMGQPVEPVTIVVAVVVVFGAIGLLTIPPLFALYRLGRWSRGEARAQHGGLFLGHPVA